MFATARVPRCEFSSCALAVVAVLLALSTSVGCSSGVDAAAGQSAPGEASPFESEVSASWQPQVGHSSRVSPTPAWDGSLDGLKTLWFDSGAKQGEGRFDHGRKQGLWTYWHEQGQKRWEGTYRDDLVDGVERSWYPNGILSFEGSSVAGKRHGGFNAWYSDGTPWWHGTYRMGVREGEFRYWRRDGSLDTKNSGTYAEGRRVSALAQGEVALAPQR